MTASLTPAPIDRDLTDPSGDERLAVRINRAFKAQQTMVRAGGNDATIWAEHQDFAVAVEAEFVDGDFLEAFAGHGFDRVAPKFLDIHERRLSKENQ